MSEYVKELEVIDVGSPTIVSNVQGEVPFSWWDTLTEPEDPFFEVSPGFPGLMNTRGGI